MPQSLLNAQGYPVLKAEWLVTRACQLFCSYCEIAHKPIKELPIEDKMRIADKLKEFNVFPVLYGGEVTISRDFEKLLQHMQEIELQYAVISNGMVNLQTLEKWATKYGLDNWSVSIDTLDFNPRPGFDDEEILRKARAGYATLVFTEGLIRDRVTCTTVTSYNIREIPSIVEEMSRIGAYTILSMVNQHKDGFRYSAPGANDMVPSQEDIVWLVKTLKRMAKQTDSEGNPKYLLHDPPQVWDMWLKHAVAADWHCSRFTKFTIDSDGFLQCCVDWKGKNFGEFNILEITRENFADIEQYFLEDIWDCKGCAWSPIKLLETEQAKGEIGHEMLRHNLSKRDMQDQLIDPSVVDETFSRPDTFAELPVVKIEGEINLPLCSEPNTN